MVKENKISLKDINEMTSQLGRKNKKQRIEKLNLAASLKIKAHQNLQKDNTREEIADLRNAVSTQIKNNDLPLDAYLDLLDGRIATLQGRIDRLEGKKLDNGGILRPGEENSLKDYLKHVEQYKKEREQVIADFKVKEQNKAKEEAERETMLREEERKRRKLEEINTGNSNE